MLTGRVEPTLLIQRLELFYRYQRQLDPAMRDLLRDQTLLAWEVNRGGFQRSLRDGRLQAGAVLDAVGTTNSELTALLEEGT